MRKLAFVFMAIALSATGLRGQTNGILSVKVTTVSETPTATSGPRGGRGGSRSYAPRNILAIWVEDNNGKFVKTLLVNSRRYTDYLTSWKSVTSAAGDTFNSVDAVTGATNINHGVRTCTWDGTDFNGNIVADGSYVVRMELTESNSAGKDVSFQVTKGMSPFSSQNGSGESFTAVSLDWKPI